MNEDLLFMYVPLFLSLVRQINYNKIFSFLAD